MSAGLASLSPSRRGLLGAGAAGMLLAPALSLPALAANRATGFRLGLHDERTRIVLDLSSRPVFRLFFLDDPARLVLDLRDSDWLVPAGALPGVTGHVAGVRHGLLDGGVTRIVLDLRTPVRVADAFPLSPREGHDWRLVVDIAASSARAFRAGVGFENAILGGDWGTARLPVSPAPSPGSSGEPSADPPSVQAGVPMPPRRPDPSGETMTATATVRTDTMTPSAFAPIPSHKPPAPRKPVIAIDPGHGGRDPGAISVGGMYEKNITLAMGKELRAALAGTGRYRVVMTRDRDVSVHLRERVRRARQAGADLFLSIHADALGNPSVRGLSVYTLSEKASDAEAAALAERENKADIILGMDFSHESPDVTNILIDLAQRETMNRSVQFANALLDELPPDVRTLNHSRRYAGFAVLKAPDVPSALLEMGYLSNHTDEKLLRQRAYRAKLARSVIRSLDRFFTATQGPRLAYSGGQ